MSEISVISNQYNTVVDTTDRVNNSIIALKKRNILLHKEGEHKFQLSEEELDSAKKYLLHFLEFLKQINDKSIPDSEYLPSIVVRDFQNKIINSVPFFEVELQTIIASISTDKNLEEKQFNLLDKMASTLDNERTALFKKLRTARGWLISLKVNW